jgi:hypothetical protein
MSFFEINSSGNNQITLNVYKINKEGENKNTPYYSRIFKADETDEIRLYGLSGNDVFKINGNTGINIRIIGGDKNDSIINNSNRKVHVYDDEKNNYIKGSNIRLHLSDSTDHTFNYDTYIPDKKGISPLLGYSREDRIFVGLGYKALTHKWRKLPFASKHAAGIRYSITQKAISVFYKGLIPSFIGKSDLILNADYDAIRWLNFYGIGNETLLTTLDKTFNRTQSKQILGDIGLQRKFGRNVLTALGFFENIEFINDADRFLAKNFAPTQPKIFETNNYAGGRLNYKFFHFNDPVVPTAGFSFSGDASHYQNLTINNKNFQKYKGAAQVYIPLISKFSIGIRATAETVNGNPQFYHLPNIGGASNLRGFRRERFYGKTAFSNSNDLRFITNLRSYIMNGKIGFNVFYDQGRVWQPTENSDTWHTDYGAGFLLAPFNKLFANITYGISKETRLLQVRIIKPF